MAEFTDRERQQIAETHDTVVQIKTVLLGANGDEGLCGDFKALAKRHNEDMITTNVRHHKLAMRFWLALGLAIGSGIISVGLHYFS